MFPTKAKLAYAKKLKAAAGYRIPDGAFNGAVLEQLAQGAGLENFDDRTHDQIMAFFRAFISKCSCKTSPFCGCPERLFVREVIELRQSGLTHKDIAEFLLDEYGIVLYPTDILSFLEESVHVLEAIHRVSSLSDRPEVETSAAGHITQIEGRDGEYGKQVDTKYKYPLNKRNKKKKEVVSLNVPKSPVMKKKDKQGHDDKKQMPQKEIEKKSKAKSPSKERCSNSSAEYMQYNPNTQTKQRYERRVRSITLLPTKNQE